MKNENQCFFSISLENGITITGQNPKEVQNYLSDLRIAVVQAFYDEESRDKDEFWLDKFNEMKDQLLDAILTIYKNMEGNKR